MTRIYLDTSVISALFDSRTPERQAQTKQVWAMLKDYEVCISEVVRDELSEVRADLKEKFLSVVEDWELHAFGQGKNKANGRPDQLGKKLSKR